MKKKIIRSKNLPLKKFYYLEVSGRGYKSFRETTSRNKALNKAKQIARKGKSVNVVWITRGVYQGKPYWEGMGTSDVIKPGKSERLLKSVYRGSLRYYSVKSGK